MNRHVSGENKGRESSIIQGFEQLQSQLKMEIPDDIEGYKQLLKKRRVEIAEETSEFETMLREVDSYNNEFLHLREGLREII